jgi:RNA polymerase-binding transcription factor DksA
MGRGLRNTGAQRTQAARILAERKSLQARLAALDRMSVLREHGQFGGDNTPTSDDLDTVQETLAREETLSARQAILQRLMVLARAEEKIREGAYGRCEACGRPIPAARLRAVPEAVRCVPCAERQERGPGQGP